MITTRREQHAVPQAAELEAPLRAVEEKLTSLGAALHRQDADAVDSVAAELYSALAAAVDRFGRAARAGGVPPPLRQRLALASAQVAAQREALARATASLDRAIDLLMPRMPTPASLPLYSNTGGADRITLPGALLV